MIIPTASSLFTMTFVEERVGPCRERPDRLCRASVIQGWIDNQASAYYGHRRKWMSDDPFYNLPRLWHLLHRGSGRDRKEKENEYPGLQKQIRIYVCTWIPSSLKPGMWITIRSSAPKKVCFITILDLYYYNRRAHSFLYDTAFTIHITGIQMDIKRQTTVNRVLNIRIKRYKCVCL